MKTVEIQCMEYKIGLNGKVFVLRNGEWVLSNNYTPAEIKQRLEDK